MAAVNGPVCIQLQPMHPLPLSMSPTSSSRSATQLLLLLQGLSLPVPQQQQQAAAAATPTAVGLPHTPTFPMLPSAIVLPQSPPQHAPAPASTHLQVDDLPGSLRSHTPSGTPDDTVVVHVLPSFQ